MGTEAQKTAFASPDPPRIAILGGGEIGKELVIVCQHWGITPIVFDKYENAPAMQVCRRFYVLDMYDLRTLQQSLLSERPDYLVWETEDFVLDILPWAEENGIRVIPSAKVSLLCLERSRLLPFLKERCKVPVPEFWLVREVEAYERVIREIGLPCIVKPSRTSSGEGQSTVESWQELSFAWNYALEGARGHNTEVLIERQIPFDQEFCLLVVASRDGLRFCKPIGYLTERGGVQEAWQPEPLVPQVLVQAQNIAEKVMQELREPGIFAFEFFLTGEQLVLGEVSCGPTDVGFVTLLGQRISQFDLHLRSMLDLPIPIDFGEQSAALRTVLAQRESDCVRIAGIEQALKNGRVMLRIFGKPGSRPFRRMGFLLATAADSAEARAEVERAWRHITVNEL